MALASLRAKMLLSVSGDCFGARPFLVEMGTTFMMLSLENNSGIKCTP